MSFTRVDMCNYSPFIFTAVEHFVNSLIQKRNNLIIKQGVVCLYMERVLKLEWNRVVSPALFSPLSQVNLLSTINSNVK